MPVQNVTYALPAGTTSASGGTGGSPPVVATAFSLAGPANGTNNVASTLTVTPVGGPLSAAATVTLAIAGGGELSATSLSFAAGATAAQSVTITRTSVGTSTVTMTNSLALTNTGSPFSFTSAALVSAGTWATVSVEPYSFVPTRTADGSPFYSANNISNTQTDAGAAITSSLIPFREFSRPSLDDKGRLYYHGGLHSGYAGNDILRITLSSPLQVTQLDRPRVPKPGDVGFSTSATPSMWKDYGTALADQTEWQPYTYHNYCKNVWHPRLLDSSGQGSYIMCTTYPVSWDGSGYPVSSTTTYGDYDGRAYGLIRYDSGTKKYIKVTNSPTAWILQDLGEYSVHFDGILGLSQHNGNFNWLEMSARNGDVMTFSRTVTANATTGAGNQFNGGNGTIIRHLEAWKYLVVHTDYADAEKQRMWTYNHGTGAVAAVAVPAPATSGGNFHVAVDKPSQTVYCLVQGTPVRVFKCRFDQLGTWTELSMTNTPSMNALTSATLGRDLAFVAKGRLWLTDFRGNAYYALTLNSPPPDITVTKTATTWTTSAVGVNISLSKHSNIGYCPLDNCIYIHGGDFQNAGTSSGSYSTEINRLNLTTGVWDRPQDRAKSGDPDQGNMAKPRPYLPDDGGWYWDSVAAKFWWVPGGGQLVQPEVRAPDFPTQSQIDTAIATYGDSQRARNEISALTRWKVYQIMTYDPAANQWATVSFTHINGAFPAYNADQANSLWMAAYGGSNGRGQAYEASTRRIFKFSNAGYLFVFDCAALTCTMLNYVVNSNNTLLVPSLGRSLNNAHQCVVTHGGKMYHVDIDTGSLIRWHIDQPVIVRGTNTSFPADRVPIDLPARPAGYAGIDQNLYAGDHCYLRVVQGGLLYWWTNPQSIDGDVRGCFWRSLTNLDTSPWIPVQFPFDYLANSVSQNALGDGSWFAMGAYASNSAGADGVPWRQPNAYWRIA